MQRTGRAILMILWMAQGLSAQIAPSAISESSQEPQPTVGYLRIFTDTDMVQVYLDGVLIGYSPILDKIPVPPGWHTISFFPPEFPWSHWTHRTRKMMMSVVEAGTHHVLVKPGELVEVQMPWHALEEQLVRYESGRRISAATGVIMVAIVFILLGKVT
jgi:hypothetical protein